MPMKFKVNLDTLNKYSTKQPYNILEINNYPMTRSAILRDNLGNVYYVNHDDELSFSGTQAIYMKKNYAEGEHPTLVYLSGTV